MKKIHTVSRFQRLKDSLRNSPTMDTNPIKIHRSRLMRNMHHFTRVFKKVIVPYKGKPECYIKGSFLFLLSSFLIPFLLSTNIARTSSGHWGNNGE